MIQFLKYRYVCYAVTAGLFLSGVAFYFLVAGFRYHIDFAGGTELRLAFEQPIEIGDLRDHVQAKDFKDAVIQTLGTEKKEYLVRVGLEEENVETRFKTNVAPLFKDNAMKIQSIEHVGAEAGVEVKWNAFKAVVISLILLLLYLAVRMQYAYGMGAVVALAHDLLVTLLFILITQQPISLSVLGAILAILGYSINDTIIIFSKIKENFVHLKHESPETIVDISINQVMRRTLLTSFSTLLSVAALLLLGGEVLYSFSSVMFVGIIAGTYSSVYIASPVMMATKP
jgi:preprotein translocase subunit SecF